jgi:hypothetical protein
MAVEFTGHMDVTIADANRVQIPVILSNINYAPTIRHNLSLQVQLFALALQSCKQ